MRACSFLPAATSIIEDLGLSGLLCGVTFECTLERPRVVRSVLEGSDLSSAEIDRRVKQAAASGENLYWLDEPLLEKLAPDVIFTQDVCAVCQIDTACVERAVARLPKRPRLVPLNPRDLAGVFADIQTIASELGEARHGAELLEKFQQRVEKVRRRVAGRPVRRVSFLEWIDPIYTCGHWIPEQIRLAGGEDLLGNPGGYSAEISWEAIRAYNPEVIVVAACGFDQARTASEMEKLRVHPGWEELEAVRAERVFPADSRLFTQPSALLVGGIEFLAEAFQVEGTLGDLSSLRSSR